MKSDNTAELVSVDYNTDPAIQMRKCMLCAESKKMPATRASKKKPFYAAGGIDPGLLKIVACAAANEQ